MHLQIVRLCLARTHTLTQWALHYSDVSENETNIAYTKY